MSAPLFLSTAHIQKLFVVCCFRKFIRLTDVAGSKVGNPRQSIFLSLLWIYHIYNYLSPCNIVGGDIVMWPFMFGLVSESVSGCVRRKPSFGHEVKGQLWIYAYGTLWTQYRLHFLPIRCHTSQVYCVWWKQDTYYFVPQGPSKIKVNFEPRNTKPSLCQLHRSVGHDRCKLSRTYERFLICDDKITENERCVIKIIGIHCETLWAQCRTQFFPYRFHSSHICDKSRMPNFWSRGQGQL